MIELITKSVKETKKVGEALAKEILRSHSQKPIIISLEGELGSGKTTFVQGFARGLGIKNKILSPTFIIMKKFKNFYHFDCYRIEKTNNLEALKFHEIFNAPRNIVLIEWANKIKRILPKNYVKIKFKYINEHERKISFA